MHIYVISPAEGSRSQPLVEQLNRLQTHTFSLFPATMLRSIPEGFDMAPAVAINRYELLPGELGCAISHRSVYLDIVASRNIWSCVLEDDARIPDIEEFEHRLNKFESRSPSSSGEVVSLYSGGALLIRWLEPGVAVCLGASSHAVGYVISDRAAEELADANKDHRFVADWPLGTKVKFRLCLPPVIEHGDRHAETLIGPRKQPLLTFMDRLEMYSLLYFVRNRPVFPNLAYYLRVVIRPRLFWNFMRVFGKRRSGSEWIYCLRGRGF